MDVLHYLLEHDPTLARVEKYKNLFTDRSGSFVAPWDRFLWEDLRSRCIRRLLPHILDQEEIFYASVVMMDVCLFRNNNISTRDRVTPKNVLAFRSILSDPSRLADAFMRCAGKMKFARHDAKGTPTEIVLAVCELMDWNLETRCSPFEIFRHIGMNEYEFENAKRFFLLSLNDSYMSPAFNSPGILTFACMKMAMARPPPTPEEHRLRIDETVERLSVLWSQGRTGKLVK